MPTCKRKVIDERPGKTKTTLPLVESEVERCFFFTHDGLYPPLRTRPVIGPSTPDVAPDESDAFHLCIARRPPWERFPSLRRNVARDAERYAAPTTATLRRKEIGRAHV